MFALIRASREIEYFQLVETFYSLISSGLLCKNLDVGRSWQAVVELLL